MHTEKKCRLQLDTTHESTQRLENLLGENTEHLDDRGGVQGFVFLLRTEACHLLISGAAGEAQGSMGSQVGGVKPQPLRRWAFTGWEGPDPAFLHLGAARSAARRRCRSAALQE